jgi:CRISPR-associated protein Cmr2
MPVPPDYNRIIAECLVYPDKPSDELINVVQEVLTGNATSREELQTLHRQLDKYKRRLALVYGGATKIKGYVFEAPKLPEIRGASALLDWVGEQQIHQIWHTLLQTNTPPGDPHPYIIYASGGSFLAFAPCDKAQELATEVERAYTEHTLTANSVAVAACFDLLELRYGRLFRDQATDSFYWVEDFIRDCQDANKWAELEQYYYLYEDSGFAANDKSEAALKWRFFNRKTFGELVTVLATMFHRRRDERASYGEPRYLTHYELMPWDEKCQSSDIRPAVIDDHVGSDTRLLSEASARKLAVGRTVKGADIGSLEQRLTPWKVPPTLKEHSWENRWRNFLHQYSDNTDAGHNDKANTKLASDLAEIGAASTTPRYIGLIYADGNNIGRLMATLKTPQTYHQVSQVLSGVAVESVFTALAHHLTPANGVYPFEILTIGGDDLFIIVPGDKAFDIALAIAQHFEQRLTAELRQLVPIQIMQVTDQEKRIRYNGQDTTAQVIRNFCPAVGLSAGVLIAQENTPFFFLRDLVEELLKSAKNLAKHNAQNNFFGGAIDFMVLKSIGMVSDNLRAFRSEALQDFKDSPRRLTARPYTWAEFAGLLASIRALKQANAPRSQLYRIQRVLLRNHTAGIFDSAMEYLYTRSRLRGISETLIEHVENAWCWPSLSMPQRVHVPPWSSRLDGTATKRRYETIWPDLLEAYEFVPAKQ